MRQKKKTNWGRVLQEGEGGIREHREAGGRGHKKPRLVWTAELHARFMNAVTHLVHMPERTLLQSTCNWSLSSPVPRWLS